MSGYRIFLNEERTVLVTIWRTGEITVALRDDASGIWGPPIRLKESS